MRYLLTVILCLAICGAVYAQPTIEESTLVQPVVEEPVVEDSFSISEFLNNLELKNGIAYSTVEGGINFLSTIEIMNWKNFTLEVGGAGDYGNTDWKAVAVVSYPLIKMSDYVEIPIIELVEANIGVWFGASRFDQVFTDIMDSETDGGVSLSLITLKW